MLIMLKELIQANMRQWPDVGLMLAHRLRRRPNISPTPDQCLMVAGYPSVTGAPSKNYYSYHHDPHMGLKSQKLSISFYLLAVNCFRCHSTEPAVVQMALIINNDTRV